ncbi:hypothetical protein [Endozoicomonas sp.]|uniref:hypothetical protein n=1 Tax=Endozoicomonas sp. TaxID=1892382 RepID=UPI00288873F6|nr:hypothetical protein [Endozoicomonas sp.]
MNNVSSGGSKALRCIQIIKTLSSAAYYQSPEAKRHVLEKGGIFGKLAQTLLLKPGIIEGISGNKAEAEAEIIRLINCLKTSLSMQQVGEIDPERVLDTLKESISQGKGAAVSDMLAYHHAGSRNDLSGRSCLY